MVPWECRALMHASVPPVKGNHCLPPGLEQNLTLKHRSQWYNHRKNHKILDIRKFTVITLQVEPRWPFLRVMRPKDAEGISDSVDPDQTAPLGAVWSGSALFAQTCLSENSGTLQYCVEVKMSTSPLLNTKSDSELCGLANFLLKFR